MSKCQKCGSERIVGIGAKCSDQCFTAIPSEHIELSGYSPCIPYVTGASEDYVRFTACLDCGQLQGKFPVESPQAGVAP